MQKKKKHGSQTSVTTGNQPLSIYSIKIHCTGVFKRKYIYLTDSQLRSVDRNGVQIQNKVLEQVLAGDTYQQKPLFFGTEVWHLLLHEECGSKSQNWCWRLPQWSCSLATPGILEGQRLHKEMLIQQSTPGYSRQQPQSEKAHLFKENSVCRKRGSLSKTRYYNNRTGQRRPKVDFYWHIILDRSNKIVLGP